MAMKLTAKTSRQQRTAEGWRAVLLEFKTSGLSVTEFCARQGLSKSCFYRWKSAVEAEHSGHDGLSQATLRPLAKNPIKGFLDLGAFASPSGPVAAAPTLLQLDLRIDLGGGLVLRLGRA